MPGSEPGGPEDAESITSPTGVDRAALLFQIRPLVEDRDAAWKEMLVTIQTEEPVYASFDDAEAEESWAAGVRSLLDLFLSVAIEDRWLRPIEIEALRTTARTRADQGVPLNAIRHSVRVAAAVARKWVVQDYQPVNDLDRAALVDLLDLIDRFANSVVDTMSEAYLVRIQQQEADRERRRARLLDELLSGRIATEEEAAKRATALDCEPGVPRALALVPPGPRTGEFETATRARIPGVVVLSLESSETPHTVMAVPTRTPQEWSTARKTLAALAQSTHLTVLLVAPSRGLMQLRHRHENTVRLVPVLARVSDGQVLLDADNLLLDALLAQLPGSSLRSFSRRILGRILTLPAAEQAELLTALATHIRCGFVAKDVAEALGVNVKTAYARRDSIEQAVGLSLGDADGQTLVTLAYHAHRLASAEEKAR